MPKQKKPDGNLSAVSSVEPVKSPGSDAWTCPVCRNPTNRFLPGWYSPFIRERANVYPVIPRSYLCNACEHVFSVPFYTRENLASIYTGYRNEEYTRRRDFHEPGYAALAPSLSDPDSPGYQLRRDFYDFFLPDKQDVKGVIVDYGGGDGYFSKYVFPKAEVVVADESYERDGGDLKGLLRRADYLFATHVFEHLPQPRDVLESLTADLRPGVPVYIELPKPYLGSLLSAFEKLEELHSRGEVLPFADILIQHEHIGHFSKNSAEVLMKSCGVEPREFYVHSAALMGFYGVRI